jgi:squalene cyclase
MAPPDVARVRRALEKAHRVLWHTQKPDGSWDMPGDLGPWVTAQVTIALKYVGALTREDAADTGRWLRSKQRKDGSFELHPFAKNGELGATACCRGALHCCGGEENLAAAAKAKQWLEVHGGDDALIERMSYGDLSPVYVALAGLLDAHRLPCPISAPVLLGPVRELLGTRFHSGVFMLALELDVIIRSLRGGFFQSALKRVVAKGCINMMTEFQNQDGSWNDSAVISVGVLPALKAAGLTLDDPVLANGVKWILRQRKRDAHGLHYDGFGTEVWSTAFDVRALLAGGVKPSDPDVSRALLWLCDAQLEIPMPAVDNRQEGAQLAHGWAFQRTNHTLPDCDDAGVVLTTLGRSLELGGLDPGLEKRLRTAVSRGHGWVFGMQNPDGGWSAFVWGLPGKKPGPIMKQPRRMSMTNPFDLAKLVIDPSGFAGDPSTEDLTSRVLHGLGHTGFTVNDPRVYRAMEFLRKQQCESGAWWGRWVVNYLSATAFVLMGLAAVKADLRAEWVQRAVRWMKSRQNPDGGYGEGPESYADEAYAGRGKSLPPLTALVVQALIDCGEGGTEECEKAVEYLLNCQRGDGSFPNREYLHTNVPPETFYLYPEAARFYPTEALGKYLEYLGHPVPPPVERWSDAQLDAARKRIDPTADAVVKEIIDRGEVKSVNELLSAVFRSDEPIPSGLPNLAKQYFADTAALPGFADPQKMKIAQRLFTRAGWEVAAGLFCSSLPQAYAAAKGARVIDATQAMTRHVKQRVFETAQFLFDAIDEGALAPGGRGIRTIQKVRLMHASVRHYLKTSGTWNAVELGEPINQEDLAGTLMTFSVVVLDALEKLGVDVSAEEAECWLHYWKVVGHVLGIEPALMPTDVADGQLLMDAIRDRQWKSSGAGHALITPLISMMEDYFVGKAFDGIPTALVRFLAGDHCADILGLPEADWTRSLVEGAGLIGHVLRDDDPTDPMARVFATLSHSLMEFIVLQQREGKQAGFRIPTSLRRTIDPAVK